MAGLLASAPLPDSASVCLEQVRELMFARDRLISAIAARVERVHRAGEAKTHGHAGTRAWLRSGCGASSGSASWLVMLATELARLPVVRERFAEGSLSEGQVSAICRAVSGLTDEQALIAEPILVGLADHATPAEVAKAGRYLREVLDPGQAGEDGDADYAQRFLVVRPTGSGGMEGEFRLPREAAARLRTWLDAYARPRVDGDDRPLRVRNADALIALLENKITTELLVLVNAESLPKDHPDPDPESESDPYSDGAEPRAGGQSDAQSKTDACSNDPTGDQSAPTRMGGISGPDASGPGARPEEPDGQEEPEGLQRSGLEQLEGLVQRGVVPGLLLATGQFLSPDDLHRLARTSTLVRLVMDADGQVLDMGRKVRLGNAAQRRAVFARYATCWIDGCPLPATMCQIDHADNWSDGGHTDLRLLGPACQFHNRDRYRRPHHYQRRQTGKDRWAFTYTGRPQYAGRRTPSTPDATTGDAQTTASTSGKKPNAP
ncbi:hypothetical protein GCM10023194_32860 [Planotetraspora phitsanulokensis]|uniref:HNH endonuclease signature motif containing protein n=1 Tax=Planotetraspora phitsanulokensis TaxID=575192 RepID=UPI0031EFCEFA